MQVTTPAYDAIGTLLPSQTYEVVSVFACNPQPETFPERIVLGLWAKDPAKSPFSTQVIPLYLSENQRDQL